MLPYTLGELKPLSLVLKLAITPSQIPGPTWVGVCEFATNEINKKITNTDFTGYNFFIPSVFKGK